MASFAQHVVNFVNLLSNNRVRYWLDILSQANIVGGTYILGNPRGLIITFDRDILVYKKVRLRTCSKTGYFHRHAVVPLVIPSHTPIRIDPQSKKCRAEHAIFDGTEAYTIFDKKKVLYRKISDRHLVTGFLYKTYTYEPGPIYPTQPPKQVVQGMRHGDECGPGIHFFFDYQSASDYTFS